MLPTGNQMSVQDLPDLDLRDGGDEPVAEAVLPTRRVSFEYPDDTNPMWVAHQPEFAAAANAISLGMPYAEPLFIRAVR